MGNYINDLNELITAKSEIKNIIQDTLNENPSEVFSYYPSYIARIATGYGGTSMDEDEINAYIAAYLSAYNFIDQDALSANSYLTSVPSEFITQDELSAMGYLTSVPEVDLSSYVTYSYADNKYFGRLTGISGLSDGNVISSIGESFDAGASVRGIYYQKTYVPSYAYVESYYTSKSELSQAGYLTAVPNTYPTYAAIENMAYITMADVSACGYIAASDIPSVVVPIVDENLIPKENLTYQLGDRTHNYKATYTSSLKSNDSGITIQINDTNKYYISSSAIRPTTTNSVNLGAENYYYAYTYTQNLLLENNTGLSKSVSSRLDINLNGDNKFYVGSGGFFPVGSKQLGSNGSKFSATYTSTLYADTIHNFIWTGTAAQYAALDNYTTYQIYMIKES